MRHVIACAVVLGLYASASADTIYVPEQYASIQTAINVSADGDVIIVGPGTYTEDLNFNGRSIEITSSNGAAQTTLHGSGVFPSIYLPYSSAGLNTGTISELTLSNHSINAVKHAFTLHGCAFIKESPHTSVIISASSGVSATLTITNCSFTSATTDTGNFVEISSYAHATVDNTSFSCHETNRLSYAIYGGQSLSVSNCSFESDGKQTWTNAVRIPYNVANEFSISNCTFENIRTGSSGLVTCSSGYPYLNLANLVINSCSTGSEGIIECFGGQMRQSVITNCTAQYGAVYAQSSGGEPMGISNTTFCQNTPTDIYGEWINGGGNEFLATCGDVEGACCVKEECYEVEQFFCESVGGEWLGFNVTCEENTCAPQPQYGACCINGEALHLYDYDCERIQGTFMGEGTDPNDVVCPEYCAGDLNFDGTVGVDDLLIVIANWGTCP